MTNCCGCQETINIETDEHSWSSIKQDYLCTGCRDTDESSLSTVMMITDGSTKKYYIGDHTRMTEYGNEIWDTELLINRQWVKTDPHRGHYDTTVDGWSSVMEGWTTGGWDDPIAQKKQKFNQWAEDICTGEIIAPVPVAIVSDPTSNVFSMGISVLTPKPVELKEWLGSEFDELSNSLF